jgi:hypothetical protein
MAASRLSDSQKAELVERYRQGESSSELAAAYGCSANTVSRTVKAALDPAEYDRLKQQRQRGAGQPPQAPVEEEPSLLAIDDADDFAGDDSDDDLDDGDDPFVAVGVAPLEAHHSALQAEPVQAQPLEASALPESLYMLVDKTVELQARPLREFAELGPLPAHEEERQALLLFANPRQAKRQCGRTQRVIKMPDPAVLVRTASYLQVKGISRVVVEGTLYALPEA